MTEDDISKLQSRMQEDANKDYLNLNNDLKQAEHDIAYDDIKRRIEKVRRAIIDTEHNGAYYCKDDNYTSFNEKEFLNHCKCNDDCAFATCAAKMLAEYFNRMGE